MSVDLLLGFGSGILFFLILTTFNLIQERKELKFLNKQSKEFIIEYLKFKESLNTRKKLKITTPKEPTKQKELPDAIDL